MSVLFDRTLAQRLSIAVPRSELSGLASWTLVARATLATSISAVNATRHYVVAFSTAVAASTRASFGVRSLGTSGLLGFSFSALRMTDAETETATLGTDALNLLMVLSGALQDPTGAALTSFMTYAGAGVTDFGSGGSSAHLYNPVAATASVAAAIGSSPDGLSGYFSGHIEDVRLYNFTPVSGLPASTFFRNILHRHGLDRPENDARLLLRWKLIGIGPVVTESDTKSGVVATAVNGPAYSRLFCRLRRRNRGG